MNHIFELEDFTQDLFGLNTRVIIESPHSFKIPDGSLDVHPITEWIKERFERQGVNVTIPELTKDLFAKGISIEGQFSLKEIEKRLGVRRCHDKKLWERMYPVYFLTDEGGMNFLWNHYNKGFYSSYEKKRNTFDKIGDFLQKGKIF